ncbi:MAG TPA: hypothetical protein VJ343_02830 [archaeon]|nr:hypothetical protein [archaeon]
MKDKKIQGVTKEEFERLKQKYPKAVTSKRGDGSERMFIKCVTYVLK